MIVDWAPWHHTAGGNHDVGLVLFNGGTFYIDDGKPMPGAIEETVRNLREIAPTWYFNVPKGYEALLPFSARRRSVAGNFFSRLKVLWFAGAALAQHVFDECQELARRRPAASAFCSRPASARPRPRPLRWRARGPPRTPPIWACRRAGMDAETGAERRQAGSACARAEHHARLLAPAGTTPQTAFDEEGFYKLGDALKFADPNDPKQGLLFDGRIAEDFKLATGTWVHVGPLRAQFVDAFRAVCARRRDRRRRTATSSPC